jgi:mono/diheme cytochrome c family protein
MRGSVILVLIALFFGTSTNAASPSGKAIFTDMCVECHEASDFSGENPNALAETIGKIVHGELKHKKALTLTNEEVALVASYMTAS